MAVRRGLPNAAQHGRIDATVRALPIPRRPAHHAGVGGSVSERAQYLQVARRARHIRSEHHVAVAIEPGLAKVVKRQDRTPARAAVAKGEPLSAEIDEAADSTPPTEEQPSEERYKDDGTITAADHDRLSLRTGGTQMMDAGKVRQIKPGERLAQIVPGDRMAPEEVMSELSGGRTRLFLILAAALVVAAMLLIYFFVLRH